MTDTRFVTDTNCGHLGSFSASVSAGVVEGTKGLFTGRWRGARLRGKLLEGVAGKLVALEVGGRVG
jgi:hypothetical protein